MGPPPLEPTPVPLLGGGPLPLESGPPPLEEAPPLPPGLKASAVPFKPTHAPPPLEPAAPLPLPVAPTTAAPRPANGAKLAAPPPPPPPEPARPEAIRAVVVEYLQKKPRSKELLNRLGVYLRSRKLAPEGGLKRFIQQQCDGRVVVVADSSKSGSDMAQLAEAAAAERAAAEQQAAAEPHAAPRPSSGADSFAPEWLEQQLMQHCVELQRGGVQPTLPLLGSFCVERLKLQMRGRLKPFLERRPQLCSIPDDTRQHVVLTPAGAMLGGGAVALAHAPLPPPPPAAALGPDALPASAKPSAPALAGPAAAGAQPAPKDYKKWDALTREIFQFVRARGVATFAQIDAHVHATCAKHVAGTGIPLAQWRSQFFLHKRRNIFRLQSTVVSLAAYVPGSSEAQPAPAPTLVEESPPLPGAEAAGAAAPAPAAAATGTGGGGAPAANPLLAAFAEERRLLEQLRDEVQAQLASLKPLSELQHENASLRAACITLGRELLCLKSEAAAFRQAAAAALATVSPAAAALLTASDADAGAPPPAMPGEAAAPAGAAAAAAAQQQWGGAGAEGPAVGEQAAATVAVASADAPPLALPVRSPAGAAPAPADSPVLPPGQLVLAGGHDGASWLDSVDCFSPADGLWVSLPLLGEPRSFAAAVGTAAEVFVAGGGNGISWYDSVVRYDRSAGPVRGWQQLAPLAVARGSLAAAVAGGYLFAFGGGKPKEQYDVAEWYDPQSDRWLPGPPLSRKRFALGGATLDGCLYAVGGYDGQSYLQCAERLDPRADRWEQLAGGMASPRGGHAVGVAGGLLFALGGFNSAQATPTCEVYEPRAGTWRTIADMADARAYGSCAVLGDTVFAVGGLQSDMQTHSLLVERYDPTGDCWRHVGLPGNANPRRSFLACCGLE